MKKVVFSLDFRRGPGEDVDVFRVNSRQGWRKEYRYGRVRRGGSDFGFTYDPHSLVTP